MKAPSLIWIGILLTQQHKSALCQNLDLSRDEYTTDRKYYKVSLGLTSIPTDIPDNALEIYIMNNPIIKIEANVFANLSQCIKLFLTSNEIREVEHGAFHGLTALVRLVIDDNRLTMLFANMFSGLSNCVFLSAYINQIKEIEPGSFNGLGNLAHLDVSNNQLTTLNASTFKGLVAPTMFLITYNRITSIEENTFARFEILDLLCLNGNALETIRPGTFSGLDSLTDLHLDDNNLETLTAGSFSGLSSLKTLQLEFNILTTLPIDVFNHLPRPLELGLSGNPLQCNSKLCWLKQEEMRGNITWVKTEDVPLNPVCKNGVNYDTFSCDVTENQKWIIVGLGISMTSIIMSAIIFVICLRRHGVKLCCVKSRGSSDDSIKQEIVTSEAPMATEDHVAYAPVPENEYAEIGEYLYAGAVPVKHYDDNAQPQAEKVYQGNVEVKIYNEPVPPRRETRI